MSLPTLTTVNPALLASVLEDSLQGPIPANRVGFGYFDITGAANENATTDGIQVTGILGSGKLFINAGTIDNPVYRELVQSGGANGAAGTVTATTVSVDFAAATAFAGGATSVAVGTLGVTFRSTGIFFNNTKISGADNRLFWEPNLASNANGLIPAFTIRAVDNNASAFNDGNDRVSTTNVNVSINVTPVNDAPVFVIGGPVNVNEDSGAFSGSIATGIGNGGGADEAGQTRAFTISSDNAGLFSTGPAVDAAGNLTFTTALNASGTAKVTLTLKDSGGTANGGVDTTTQTFNINVTAQNDAPVNAVPGAQVITGAPLVFSTANSNAISISDVDAGTAVVTTTVSVNAGTLAVTAMPSGATVTPNMANTSIVISGTTTQINAALQGLTFTGMSNATLTVRTDDGGATGAGPVGTDMDTIAITAAPFVVNVSEPANGSYNNGDTISFTVNYSGAVTVTGTPRIQLDVGGQTFFANYASGSPGTNLVFTYTVGAAENDNNGIAIVGNAIQLNSGTIIGAGGNAGLILAGVDSLAGVLVDNTAPGAPVLDLLAATDSFGVGTTGNNTDNITNINPSTLTGTAEAGSTVLFWNDLNNNGTYDPGTEFLGTAVANASGVFTFTNNNLVANVVNKVSAFATDLAGNKSLQSSFLSITFDNTAPTVPDALNLAAADDSGTSDSDNITITTTGLTIDGTGENGSVVTLFDDVDNDAVQDMGEATLGVTSVGAGVWTTDIALAEGTHNVRGFATDIAGNVSAASAALVITVASKDGPAVPAALNLADADDKGASNTDNITNLASGLTINGTGTNGSFITLFNDIGAAGFDAGDTILASGLAVTAGVWSGDIALGAGVHNVRAFATDGVGNTSKDSVALSITVDLTAPAAPFGLDLVDADDTGSSSTDGITSQTTLLTFRGAAVSGDTVTVFDDKDYDGVVDAGEALGSGVANLEVGNVFQFDVTVTGESLHKIRAIATDVAGNTGPATQASGGVFLNSADFLSLTIDTKAPDAPTIDLASGSDSFGSGTAGTNTDNLTNQSSVDVFGTTESASPDTVVTVFIDGDGDAAFDEGEASTVTTAEGTSWFATLGLPEGDGASKVYAFATDAAGNKSAVSSLLTITLDQTADAAPTGLLLDAKDDTGRSQSDGVTKNTTGLTITGSGVEGSFVTLFNASGTAVATGLVGEAGTFSAELGTLADGTYVLTAKSVDAAGNQSAASASVTVVVDSVAPGAPIGLDIPGSGIGTPALPDDDSGSSDTDNITNVNVGLTLRGVADKGSLVYVFNDADGMGTAALMGEVLGSGLTVDTEVITGISNVFNVDLGTVATPLTDGTYKFRVYAEDLAGNIGVATIAGSGVNGDGAANFLLATIDTVAPNAPANLNLAALDDSGKVGDDNVTKVTTNLTIDGTGEVGTTITLFADNLASGSGTLGVFDMGIDTVLTLVGDPIIVGSGGTWVADIASLADGTYKIHARSADAAGNESKASTPALTLVIDSKAPDAPLTLNLLEAQDTGSSNTDNITRINTGLVIDGKAEAGSFVTLFDDNLTMGSGMVGKYDVGIDTILGTATATASGTWIIATSGTLIDGLHTISAIASDLAGNESLAASGLDITVDTLIPETPTAPDLAAADDTGASNTDNITFTTKGLTFSGTVPLSKNASTVSLFIDKTTEGVLGAFDVTEEVIGTGAVDQMTGMWSIDTNLTEGTYVIRSFATDVAGNQSAASVDGVPVNVVVDTTAPLAPTNLDLDAADDSGSSPTDNITKVNQDLTITGSGVIGATVELYETIGSGTALVGSGVVNASGIFSIEVAPLGMLSVVADGVHTYTAVQYDTAGNKSLSSSPALAITIDTKGPNVSYDSSYYNAATNTLTLQGQGFKEITLSTVDVTAVSIDTNDDATDEVTLAASGTVVAIVDDRTLTVTLNNANAAAFEASKDFGNLGFLNNELNPLDLLDITFKFAGTDVAGNTSTGATTDLGILGAQNDTGIQRDYLVDLSAASGAVDETFGDNVAQIDFTTVNTLRFEGVSAAQLSVSANKMDGFNVSDTSVLGEGTSNAVDIINTGGAPSFAGLGLTFVDGSQFQDNTGGASTTLRSGSGNDQLLAGNAGDRLLGNAGNDLLVGGNGSDSIYGGSGDDILFGDSGNDYLSGGSGSDSFLFTGFDGHDVITGFGSTDVIHTLGFESVGSAEDLRALAVQSGADTLLVLGEGDNSVRLLGTIAANLTAANFAVDSFYVLRGDFVSGF